MDEACVFSTATTTPLELVFAAVAKASGPHRGPVGRVELTECSDPSTSATLSLEAAVAQQGHGWTIEQLDLKFVQQQAFSLGPDVLTQLLQQFGGAAFTSLTLATPTVELMDFTLSFSPGLRWVARNVLLSSPGLAHEQLEICCQALAMLGVRCQKTVAGLRVPSTELRRRLTPRAQAEVFQFALTRTPHVELYVSALPAVQAVRVAARAGLQSALEIGISFGLSSARPPSSEMALQAQKFLEHNFQVRFSDKKWRVRNTHS